MLRAELTYLAATIVLLVSLVGIALTLLTLPGAWLIILTAALSNWWQPGGAAIFSWWTIGICAAVALLGEIIEFAAGAVGATKAGGSKTGAAGAIIGTIVGAVVGTFVPPPPLGTIIGGAVGAGLGAMLAERYIKKKDAGASARIAAGAAVGRLISTFVKVAICAGVGIALTVAAFV